MAAVRISKIFRLFYPILGLLIVLSNYSGCSKEDTATGTEESGKETEETSEETADTADEETAAPSIDTIPTVEEETGSAATAEEASETAPATDEETGTSVDIDETSPTEPSEEIATVSPSEITEETPTEEETGEESPSDEEAPAEHDEEETTEPGIRNAPAGSTACYNDKDDDGDKFPDYSDPSCLAGATVEADCANGLDDDADGKIDSADSGCVTAAGASGGKEGYYPDGDFGGDGIVVVDNDEEGATDKNGQDAIYAMAPDSKGRIVAVGRYTTSGTSDDFYQHTGSTDGATDMMVMRFLPDGTLDPSFGSGGVAKPGDGPKNEGAKGEAVAVDSQGRIVAAGYTYNNDWDGNTSDYDSKDLIIWRLDENGKLDTSCNNTGYFIYSIPGRSAAEAIQALAIDTSDGTDRIVAVGGSFDDSCSTSAGCNDFDLLLLRLTEKCQLDTSLIDPDLINASGYPGGYLLAGDMQNIWAYDYGLALTVDAEGRYVVGGRSSHKDNGNNYEMALWRFNPDGTPDTKFGDRNGWVLHSGLGYVGANYTDEARGVAVDSAGNIVAAGYTTGADFSTDVAVWRYTKDGVLDAGFGDGDGFVTYNSNITDWAYAVAVDPSDRIVVGGGLSMSASDMDLFVMRLKNNGVLDATFSSDGLITHSATAGCNGIEKAYTVIANGGEIFAGGTGLNCGSKGDSTLLKITGEGKLDTNFDAEGVASTEGYRESYQEYGQAVAQNTATGKIYLAGYQKASTGYSDMAIWGFNADGTPDTSFGTDGVLTTTADFADKNRWTAAGDDFIQGAAVDSQGRIVAAGYSTWAAGFSPMLVVWRFNADGTLDATFSDDGFYWAYSASNGDQKGHAVIVDSSNNIVVAGEQNNTMALWLFDANGKLTASASDSANEGVGHAVAFDSSGRILIAGKRENSSTGDDDMAIWRYNPDGNPDASFGTNGVFMTKASGDDVGNGMALDSSGNIFVVGQSTDASGNTRATVWLYDVTKGRLDTNFDGDGVWVDTGGAGDKSEAYSAAYDGDGFLVTGAGNVTETTQDFALWYFASTGIDKTFGNAGLILKSGSTGGKMDAGYSVMFDLASKKILVGGSSQDADNSSRGAVWRLY